MAEAKKKVFLLGSEGCGAGDPDLGYEIMTVVLGALADREDRPSAIVCWNTAVKLLAEGSPLVPQLKALEAKGTRILAGQLCVNALGLDGKLVVGEAATLGQIFDLILHEDVVSL
jgi:hypothetical protein